MRRFKMLVFSEPFEGRDDEFNAWYTGRHLDDICALQGFTTAQRFTLHGVSMGTSLNRYLAIYDMETDVPDRVIENMFAARDTPAMPIDPSFNLDATTVMLYEHISDLVTAKDGHHSANGPARKFRALVFAEPFAGRDDEFNAWANDEHLDHICALPGFASAQRYRLHSVSMGTTLNKYLAIYEIESGDPDARINNMIALGGTPAMPLSPAFNVGATTMMVYEQLTPQVFARA
jgi:hypothetical protein